MKRYIYDGSFSGLLTSIHEAYYRKENIEDIVSEDSTQENLLIESIHISTDEGKAKRVYDAILNKISEKALRCVFYVYLSEDIDHGINILQYLKLGFKLGSRVDSHLSNDIVLKMSNIYQKVAKEKHRMTGIIRFKQLENGIFYSTIEPDYNVIGLLARHFSSRMKNENWVVHDLKRGTGLLYNKKEWIVKDIKISDPLIMEGDEETYQELWKAYFKATAIQNKINPSLQKKNMPMRYWKHLVEKS